MGIKKPLQLDVLTNKIINGTCKARERDEKRMYYLFAECQIVAETSGKCINVECRARPALSEIKKMLIPKKDKTFPLSLHQGSSLEYAQFCQIGLFLSITIYLENQHF